MGLEKFDSTGFLVGSLFFRGTSREYRPKASEKVVLSASFWETPPVHFSGDLIRNSRGLSLKFNFQWGNIFRNGLKYWSGKRDSNPRPSPWQGDALPLSYSRNNGGEDKIAIIQDIVKKNSEYQFDNENQFDLQENIFRCNLSEP